jgi:hypothetical protein
VKTPEKKNTSQKEKRDIQEVMEPTPSVNSKAKKKLKEEEK